MPTFPHHRNKRAAAPAEGRSKRSKFWAACRDSEAERVIGHISVLLKEHFVM